MDDLQRLADRWRDTLLPGIHDSALVGNRHYWKSDFMVHHRRGWYASARMHSTRVDNTDSCCTNENRKSHLIADDCKRHRAGRERQ